MVCAVEKGTGEQRHGEARIGAHEGKRADAVFFLRAGGCVLVRMAEGRKRQRGNERGDNVAGQENGRSKALDENAEEEGAHGIAHAADAAAEAVNNAVAGLRGDEAHRIHKGRHGDLNCAEEQENRREDDVAAVREEGERRERAGEQRQRNCTVPLKQLLAAADDLRKDGRDDDRKQRGCRCDRTDGTAGETVMLHQRGDEGPDDAVAGPENRMDERIAEIHMLWQGSHLLDFKLK